MDILGFSISLLAVYFVYLQDYILKDIQAYYRGFLDFFLTDFLAPECEFF